MCVCVYAALNVGCTLKWAKQLCDTGLLPGGGTFVYLDSFQWSKMRKRACNCSKRKKERKKKEKQTNNENICVIFAIMDVVIWIWDFDFLISLYLRHNLGMRSKMAQIIMFASSLCGPMLPNNSEYLRRRKSNWIRCIDANARKKQQINGFAKQWTKKYHNWLNNRVCRLHQIVRADIWERGERYVFTRYCLLLPVCLLFDVWIWSRKIFFFGIFSAVDFSTEHINCCNVPWSICVFLTKFYTFCTTFTPSLRFTLYSWYVEWYVSA